MSAKTEAVGNVSAIASVADHAHWLLRAAIASVFFFHGLQKFLGAGIEGFSSMMGLPVLIAFLVAAAEVLGGAGILAGGVMRSRLGDAITRLSGAAVVPVMAGAIIMVHWGRWNFTPTEAHPMGGMEFQAVLLLIGLYFIVRGNDA